MMIGTATTNDSVERNSAADWESNWGSLIFEVRLSPQNRNIWVDSGNRASARGKRNGSLETCRVKRSCAPWSVAFHRRRAPILEARGALLDESIGLSLTLPREIRMRTAMPVAVIEEICQRRQSFWPKSTQIRTNPNSYPLQYPLHFQKMDLKR
jgi:hypothetical protein